MENVYPKKHIKISNRQICLVSIIWAFGMLAISFGGGITLWLTLPVIFIGIVFLPGFLLLNILQVNINSLFLRCLYSIGIGFSFVIFGGFLLNWFLPLVGVFEPLGKIPLTIFFSFSLVAISLLTYFKDKKYVFEQDFLISNTLNIFLGVVPAIFVLMSIFGAQVLNNFGPGYITTLMLSGIAVYVAVLMYYGERIQSWVYVMALYTISLSLLLMYSLRSAHILGWDINAEYQVFQGTLKNLVWKMSAYPGLDYNACLSITILPTIFKVLTNISSEYIFKVVFQMFFAITPVAIYAFGRKYIKDNLAFLASFLVISQTWFFEQMPGLIRQEVAFIFFALLLLVLFDKEISARARSILFYTFVFTLVVSHYSTSYIWIAMMIGIIITSYFTKLLFLDFKKLPIFITTMMIVVPLVFLFIWEVPVTGTASAFKNFLKNDSSMIVSTSTSLTVDNFVSTSSVSTSDVVRGVVALPAVPAVATSNLFSKLWNETILKQRDSFNTDENVSLAHQKIIIKYGANGGYDTYPESNLFPRSSKAVNDRPLNESFLPNFVEDLIIFISNFNRLLFAGVFSLIGIVALCLGLRKNPTREKYDLMILGICAYLLLLLMASIPYLQQYYNFTRLYIQMFFILCLHVVIGGLFIIKYFSKYGVSILVGMSLLVFLSSTGFIDLLAGGPRRVTLNIPPGNLDTFYIYDNEVYSASWLGGRRKSEEAVQADVIAALRLQSFADISANSFAILPQTIRRGSYIYLSNINTLEKKSFYLYENGLLEFEYSLDFLDLNKNLIYNSGGSRIYK